MEMIALLTSKNRVGHAEERNSPKEKKVHIQSISPDTDFSHFITYT